MRKIDFAGLPWDHPHPGARHKIWTGGANRLRILELRPEFVEPDWCQKAHIGMVLEGAIEVDFQGTIERFSTGDGLAIPAGDSHKARALTPVARLVLFEPAEAGSR